MIYLLAYFFIGFIVLTISAKVFKAPSREDSDGSVLGFLLFWPMVVVLFVIWGISHMLNLYVAKLQGDR